jgi:hypothetical protein
MTAASNEIDERQIADLISLRRLELAFDGIGRFGGIDTSRKFISNGTGYDSCATWSFTFPDSIDDVAKLFE